MSSDGYCYQQTFHWSRLPSPQPEAYIEEIPDEAVPASADAATDPATSAAVCHPEAHASPVLPVPTPSAGRPSRKRSRSSLDREAGSPQVHDGAGPSNVAAPTCIAPQLTLLSHSASTAPGALVPAPAQGVASSSRTPTSQVVSGGYTGGGSGPLPGGSSNGSSVPKMPFSLGGLIPSDVPATWSLTTTVDFPEAPQPRGGAPENSESARPSKRQRIAPPAPPVPTAQAQPAASRTPHLQQAAPQPTLAPRPVRAQPPVVAGGNLNTFPQGYLPVPGGMPAMRGPQGLPFHPGRSASVGGAHSAAPMRYYLPAPAPLGRAHSMAGYPAPQWNVPHGSLAMAMGGARVQGHSPAPPQMQAPRVQAQQRPVAPQQPGNVPPAHFAPQPGFNGGMHGGRGPPAYTAYFPQPPIGTPAPSHAPAHAALPRFPQYPMAPPSYPAGPLNIAQAQGAPGPSATYPVPIAGPSTDHADGLKRKNASRESTVEPMAAPKRARRSRRLAQQVPSGAESAEAGPSSSTATRSTTRRRGPSTRKPSKRSKRASRASARDEEDDEDAYDNDPQSEVGTEAFERYKQAMRERGEEGEVIVRRTPAGREEFTVTKVGKGTYIAFQLDMGHWANQFPEGSPGRAGMEALQSQMHLHTVMTSTSDLLESCKVGKTQLEVQYLADDLVPLESLCKCYLNVKEWFFSRNPVSADGARRKQVAQHAKEDAKKYERPKTKEGSLKHTAKLEPWPEYAYFKDTKQYAMFGTKLLVTQYTDAPKTRWDVIKHAMKCLDARVIHDVDLLRQANEAYEKFKQESQAAASAPCTFDEALQILTAVDESDLTEEEVKRASNVVFGALRVPDVALPAKVWRDVSAASRPDPFRFVREVAFVRQWHAYYTNPDVCPKPAMELN